MDPEHPSSSSTPLPDDEITLAALDANLEEVEAATRARARARRIAATHHDAGRQQSRLVPARLVVTFDSAPDLRHYARRTGPSAVDEYLQEHPTVPRGSDPDDAERLLAPVTAASDTTSTVSSSADAFAHPRDRVPVVQARLGTIPLAPSVSASSAMPAQVSRAPRASRPPPRPVSSPPRQGAPPPFIDITSPPKTSGRRKASPSPYRRPSTFSPVTAPLQAPSPPPPSLFAQTVSRPSSYQRGLPMRYLRHEGRPSRGPDPRSPALPQVSPTTSRGPPNVPATAPSPRVSRPLRAIGRGQQRKQPLEPSSQAPLQSSEPQQPGASMVPLPHYQRRDTIPELLSLPTARPRPVAPTSRDVPRAQPLQVINLDRPVITAVEDLLTPSFRSSITYSWWDERRNPRVLRTLVFPTVEHLLIYTYLELRRLYWISAELEERLANISIGRAVTDFYDPHRFTTDTNRGAHNLNNWRYICQFILYEYFRRRHAQELAFREAVARLPMIDIQGTSVVVGPIYGIALNHFIRALQGHAPMPSPTAFLIGDSHLWYHRHLVCNGFQILSMRGLNYRSAGWLAQALNGPAIRVFAFFLGTNDIQRDPPRHLHQFYQPPARNARDGSHHPVSSPYLINLISNTCQELRNQNPQLRRLYITTILPRYNDAPAHLDIRQWERRSSAKLGRMEVVVAQVNLRLLTAFLSQRVPTIIVIPIHLIVQDPQWFQFNEETQRFEIHLTEHGLQRVFDFLTGYLIIPPE